MSRTADKFLEKLFEQEIPEVFDGLITIKKVVRISGEKAKVAVDSMMIELIQLELCWNERFSYSRNCS
jgi:transcription antitermination factor NusA-like protein